MLHRFAEPQHVGKALAGSGPAGNNIAYPTNNNAAHDTHALCVVGCPVTARLCMTELTIGEVAPLQPIKNPEVPQPDLNNWQKASGWEVGKPLLKRLFDVVFAAIMLPVFALPLILIGIAIRLTSPGPAIYWSNRVGINNRLFRMPKFRTMKVGTPEITTHLLPDPDTYITSLGKFLRLTSLDELPQLWSILVGHMSVVGPRPALFNQDDLIALRSEAGVQNIIPGLTGWAQINGRDKLAIAEKARFDEAYMREQSFLLDLKIIFLTFDRVLRCQGISH